jgi:hypothetical protein
MKMKNEMTITETKTNKSLTGSFFKVYINGQLVATRTTREAAEEAGKKILEKKVYRS